MTSVTRDEVRIPISEELPEILGWLNKIIKKSDPPRTSKPPIQKVAQTLRRIRANRTCFDPSVVSFGPWHRGRPHLELMEREKEVAARWFISLGAGDNWENAINMEEAAKQVYDEFVKKVPSVSSLRNCYTLHESVDKINDADFMRMMFLDGCFTLYFIRLFLDESSDPLETSHLNRPLILRDMFLLENQIPYSVLDTLKSLKPSSMPEKHKDDWAVSFFKAVFLPPSFFVSYSLLKTAFIITLVPILVMLFLIMLLPILVFLLARRWISRCPCLADSRSEEGTELQTEPPLHLLDLLRSELTGTGVDPSSHGTRYWNYNFRSISELKAAGILVSASNSKSLSLNNIKLKKGLIDSYLELPRIIIDDSTKTRLLNLVAYEMCPDGSLGNHKVTSYICFLDSLIYNADDVKELRSRNIMLNRLGSDEEVVNLFKELATNLSPDYNAFQNVIDGMEKHFQRDFNHLRTWIGQFIRIHFTSPWTAISLTAAIFVILLTLVQTIYSVLSFYKID